jgi:putative aldouronate transport system substrate-binding protein
MTLRVPAMALVLTLLVSLGAFAGGSGQRAASGLTTLTVVPQSYYPPGILEGYYWTEILKEDLGIVFDIWSNTPENYQTYLSAQDLPDIAFTGNRGFVNTMVQADLLINLDDYKDKLPSVFANGGAMIQYMRDNVSNNTGRLNLLRTFVSNKSNTRGGNNFGPYLRWDYYKELGMPVITEFEDYLPVLKAMVDRHPLTEDGQKVYGISLWSDWDGSYMAAASYPMNMMGQHTPGGFLEMDLKTGASRSFLDDTSYYKRALKFYYDANQMGILDPESVTQGWSTLMEKATAGRSLFGLQTYAFGTFNTAEVAAAGIGAKLVYCLVDI